MIFCHSGLFFALLPPYGPRNTLQIVPSMEVMMYGS